MSKKSRLLLYIFITFSILYTVHSAPEVFEKGEKLNYEISFLGIGFAKIEIESLGLDKFRDMDAYHIIFKINTYKGIPFLSAHVKYEGWIDKSMTHSVGFDGYSLLDDGTWELHRINYDYDSSMIKTEKFIHGKLKEVFKIGTGKKWCDGVGMFFLIRKYIHLGRNIIVPTVMGNDTASTILKLKGQKESVEIDAIPYPVDAVYVNGIGRWKGVYGVNGKFKAWYSDDDYRIPLKAEMNLYIGTVDIELKKWSRPGWKPPEYPNQN